MLDDYVARLLAAATTQNLIARSTVETVWSRHILDSIQLIGLAPSNEAWLDIGSGAGLPGIVIAIVTGAEMTLVEPRAKRAAFLAETADALGLAARVAVLPSRIERLPRRSIPIVTARAVAPLADLFAMAEHIASPETLWLLPKGRTAPEEVAAAEVAWQGDFKLAPSQTDSQATIVVARGIRRRERR